MNNPAALPRAMRWPVLALAGACLLIGLTLALRLVLAPTAGHPPSQVHGQVMVLGFVGTLIALERVVAARRAALLFAPAALGVGGLLLLTPAPIAGRLLQVAGSAGLVLTYLVLARRTLTGALALQILGGVGALGASALWLAGAGTWAAIPFVAAFFVLTILGERVELAQIALSARAHATAVGLGAGLLAAATAAGAGLPGEIVALALLAISGWLLTCDVARRTIAARGLTRYTAANMLAASGWLAVAGVAWLAGGSLRTSPVYDTVVHALTIGFTLSMILAHAPIILPAVLRRPLPYRPALWVPTLALNAGLAVRVAGDVRASGPAWQVGGVLTVVAVLAFVLTAAICAARAGTTVRSLR